jgi:hypothetical protein
MRSLSWPIGENKGLEQGVPFLLKITYMKKLIFGILSIFIGHGVVVGQVRLEWKIEAGKPMYYQAVLDVASTAFCHWGQRPSGKSNFRTGKWLEYDAVFTLESMGMMTGKMKGIFSMRPVEDIPAPFKQ